MRVAVTTVALNEEQFVERWAAAAAAADSLIIADTGSKDKTVAAAENFGVTVHQITVKPWRFDVARNSLLTLTPENIDVVLHIDMDEVLIDGWREKLEKVYEAGNRYSYNYIWSWLPNGEPDIIFDGDKCHRRDGWIWKHPCHEALYPIGQKEQKVQADFEVHHFPDQKKSRSNYLDLLKMAVIEEPQNDRMAHYYARELYLQGDWNAARKEFVRHLALPTAIWPAERAQSYRYLAKMDDHPERWFLKAISEDPNRRDAIVDLVDFYLQNGMQEEAIGMAQRALRIDGNSKQYITNHHANDNQYLRRIIERSIVSPTARF